MPLGMNVVPICPEHDEELRIEYLVEEDDRGWVSGFCFKCAKHYRLCSANRYCDGCIKLKGHDSSHMDSGGHIWEGEFNKA